MGAKESAVAKSKGPQNERDMTLPDSVFLKVLYRKRTIPKDKASYQPNGGAPGLSCIKCKFNLGDERRCHVVGGKIDNEKGISKYFSPKGDGMLPGDVVWMYVKKMGRKLKRQEGHIIEKGATGFRCKDCKYYLYSGHCLIIEGRFKPKMSCGFIVKIGHGTEV